MNADGRNARPSDIKQTMKIVALAAFFSALELDILFLLLKIFWSSCKYRNDLKLKICEANNLVQVANLLASRCELPGRRRRNAHQRRRSSFAVGLYKSNEMKTHKEHSQMTLIRAKRLTVAIKNIVLRWCISVRRFRRGRSPALSTAPRPRPARGWTFYSCA